MKTKLTDYLGWQGTTILIVAIMAALADAIFNCECEEEAIDRGLVLFVEEGKTTVAVFGPEGMERAYDVDRNELTEWAIVEMLRKEASK